MSPVTRERHGEAVRWPAVAGRFYPADPDVLRADLAWCYAHPLGPGSLPGPGLGPAPIALVSPHAGLRYSGPFAANAYSGLGAVRRAIVVGPNHGGRGAPLALAPPLPWRTPLGDLPGDPDLLAALQAADPDLRLDADAHAAEHSVELQAIFLQYALGAGVSLTGIALGSVPPERCLALGRALAAVQAHHPALLVASTDLSHYLPDDLAQRRDAPAIAAVERLDAEGLLGLLRAGRVQLCGAAPVLAVLAAARELGARSARLLRSGTSADTGGDAAAVVGYAALRIDASSGANPDQRKEPPSRTSAPAQNAMIPR